MPNIVIKSADKGVTVVIPSREQYLKEGRRQLAHSKFYKKQESFDTTLTNMNTINEFINTLFVNSEIDSSLYEYLLNKECWTPILYLLPKIHKGINPPPSRPIISAVSIHTEKLSKFVDHFLNPCAQKVRSYLRDTIHLQTSLEDFRDLPADTWLVTANVVSLYTTIPTKTSVSYTCKYNINCKSSNLIYCITCKT